MVVGTGGALANRGDRMQDDPFEKADTIQRGRATGRRKGVV